jgi:hypothetical protein
MADLAAKEHAKRQNTMRLAHCRPLPLQEQRFVIQGPYTRRQPTDHEINQFVVHDAANKAGPLSSLCFSMVWNLEDDEVAELAKELDKCCLGKEFNGKEVRRILKEKVEESNRKLQEEVNDCFPAWWSKMELLD